MLQSKPIKSDELKTKFREEDHLSAFKEHTFLKEGAFNKRSKPLKRNFDDSSFLGLKFENKKSNFSHLDSSFKFDDDEIDSPFPEESSTKSSSFHLHQGTSSSFSSRLPPSKSPEDECKGRKSKLESCSANFSNDDCLPEKYSTSGDSTSEFSKELPISTTKISNSSENLHFGEKELNCVNVNSPTETSTSRNMTKASSLKRGIKRKCVEDSDNSNVESSAKSGCEKRSKTFETDYRKNVEEDMSSDHSKFVGRLSDVEEMKDHADLKGTKVSFFIFFIFC